MSELWFQRSFDFSIPLERLPSIVERLRGTPARIDERVHEIPAPLLTHTVEGKWSIQENIGHLVDLEALWTRRAQQFFAGDARLAVADLENRQTHEANHNARPVRDLLADFRGARREFVSLLTRADATVQQRTALHPRLGTRMRLIDLAFFVAEHDDHHLAEITRLAAMQANE